MSMEKVSNLISKKVISLEDANMVGYVLNVIFDNDVRYFTGLIIVDDETENSYVLARENISAISSETIMIKSAKDLQYNISSLSNNPIGKVVYDCKGNNLGVVRDVEIKGKLVTKILTTFCEFSSRYIRKAGDNFIIFGSRRNAKKKTFKEDVLVSGLPPLTVKITDNNSNNIMQMPARIYASPSGLIGRVMTQDLLGYNNELIAYKNETINQKIINKAKLHNKLNLLNYYSK